MDFNDTPEQAEFRAEAKAWLADHAPAHELPLGHVMSEEEEIRRGRAWQAAKASGGFGAILWPRDIGLRGGSSIEAVIFAEEEARYNVNNIIPISIGLNFAVPTIIKHGTPEQLTRFGEPTLRGT